MHHTGSPNVTYIEIIHTQPKVVICAKLDPKTDGCQTWHLANLCNSTIIETYGDMIRVSHGFDGCQMLEYIAVTCNFYITDFWEYRPEGTARYDNILGY